tara:strand:- start:9798 stop:10082 length:285 start_codon:yes stop_codon:yes gene_type:complete
MEDQPVGHFMGNNVIKKSRSIFPQQHRVQAYAAMPHVGLTCGGTAQVKPYSRGGQRWIHFTTALPRLLYTYPRGLLQCCFRHSYQLIGWPWRQW